MHRIDTPKRSPNLFGTGKAGFVNATPGLVAPTSLDYAYMNALQEELCRLVEDAGLAPLAKGTNTQVLSAAKSVITHQAAKGFWGETDGAKNFAMNGLAYDSFHNTLVAVGGADGADAYVLKSVGGRVWTEKAPLTGNYTLRGVCYDASAAHRLVAVGDNDGTDSVISYSDDGGDTWAAADPPDVNKILYAVAHNGTNLYNAVGQKNGTDPHMMSSADGATWTVRTPAVAANLDLYGVAYGNGLWVAVGENTGTNPYIISSANGTTGWTARTPTVARNKKLYGVAHNGKTGSDALWIAVGETTVGSGYILTSPDGVVWTERSNPSLVSLRAVAYGNGVWVAVGDSTAGQGPGVVVSVDGTTWTRVNPGAKDFALYAVCYALGKWNVIGAADGTDPYMLQTMLATPA